MKANSARRSLGLALGLAALTLPAFAEWQSGLRGGDTGANNDNWKTIDVELNQTFPSPEVATQSVAAAFANHVWVYKGKIHLDGPCWFGENFDDGAFLKIDGDILVEDGMWNNFTTKKKFEGEAGWHDFELRLYNGGNGGGAHGKLQNGKSCGFGICMNAAKPTKMEECSYPTNSVGKLFFRYDDGTGFATEGLLTAVSPPGLPAACEPPAGWKHGLASNDTVECSASAELLHEGAHYTNNIGCILQTWDAAANDWGAPTTNANNGAYTYTHGAASGKITWPYVRDGWRLDAEPLQPQLGLIEVQAASGSELSGGCYRTGTVVTLTATAQGGSNFIAWREDGTNYSTETTIEVTMDRAYALRAVFESIALTWAGQNVEWAAGAYGWLSADGSPAPWRNGSTAVFTNVVDQVVTITNEGVFAAAVCFEGAAPVTLTGGTLTMVEAAKLVATNAADVRIETQLAGENGLTIVHGKKAVFTDEITDEDQVVFPGTQLADIGLIVGSTCGSSIPADKPYIPCQDRMLENGRRIQFQMCDASSGQETKFVRVLFTQAESGVQAKRLAVNGIATGKLDGFWVGSDMDREDGVEQGAFGIKGLTAQVAPGRFVINAATAFSGQLTLESGRLEFGPEGKLNENGSFPGAVVNNGMILLPPAEQTFTGPVSGTGRFFVRGEPSQPPAVASFRGKAEWTGGLTVLTNACVDITYEGNQDQLDSSGLSFPKTGTVEAYDGGEIRCFQRAGVPNPVHLRRGGALRFSANGHRYSFYNAKRKIFIENAVLYTTSGDATHCKNYVNHLDVLNGGTVEGNPCRVGCGQDKGEALWRVCGNAPCYQKAGFHLTYVSPQPLTLDVGVTGNSAGDMFVSGPMKRGAEGSADKLFTINKKGAGTVVFSGDNSSQYCLTKITEGTLRFETDKALGGAGNIIELNGGMLDLGTGTNTPSGGVALSLTAPSRLKPSSGAIAFAVPDEGAWADAETATLTIVGELGERTVKFGADKYSLNDEQLAQIKLDGDPQAKFKLDGQGWLCLDKSSGTILILR